ncbi:hypothetical protein [Naasia sp. SYSU D00948]|uniref:hypothetical protein n=1 Tax=Naasia sp. SYSU D00948 TaxID=2817379 RepID=UPI001B307EB5|nr:hypothetical protein [Naasia sp. SYSU D00948]
MRGKSWGRTGIVALAALMLTGCGGGAPADDPTPSATRPASPSATAEPTPAEPTPTESADPVAEVDEIAIRPTGIELRAGGEVVEVLDYTSPAADAIATLTEAIGSAPVDEPYEGGFHNPPGVLHTWGGFVLDERFYGDEQAGSATSPYGVPSFAVFAEGPTAGELSVSAGQGRRIGDSAAVIDAGYPLGPDQMVCQGTPIEGVEIDGSIVTVAAYSDDGATVTWLGAPAMVQDACV